MEKALTALVIVATIVLGAIQLALTIPAYWIARLVRVLRRASPPPKGGPYDRPDATTLLRWAAGSRGVTPSTLGAVAVAQARVGDHAEGRRTLARADELLVRITGIPRFLRWDDSVSPEIEAKYLRQERGRFAAVLSGGQTEPPRRLDPAAVTWLQMCLRPDHPVRVAADGRDLAGALRLARAERREPVSAQPAAALAYVAVKLSDTGDGDGAAATLREAVAAARRFSNIWPIGDDSGYRERALASLAVLQVVVGQTADAWRTMDLIYDQESADLAARDAAIVLARGGNARGAFEFLWLIADRDQRAKAILDVVEEMAE